MNKAFQTRKKDILTRLDKSRAKEIDKPIRSLIERINAIGSLHTNSSCSGRLVLLANVLNKKDSYWIYKTHDMPLASAAWASLKEVNNPVWLMFEDLIIHITAQDMHAAKRLLSELRSVGLKRSGIISLGKFPVIELIGSEHLETPVADAGKVLVSKNYFDYLIAICKKKLEKNREKIKSLESLFALYNH